jgi:hypothetical protein
VSQSSRVPRRLRRAIPRDPSAGAATAIVGGAIAAAVVLIVVIAVTASALTSGSGPGNTGVAAAGGSSGSGNCTLYENFEYEGTATLPVTAASLASSMEQVNTACTGHAIPVTCNDPTNYSAYIPGTVLYACSPPAQDVQEAQTPQGVGMGEGDGVVVYPATGLWIDKN